MQFKKMLEGFDKNWLMAVLSSVGDGVISIDEQNIITFANNKSCEIIGLPVESLVDKDIDEVFVIQNDEYIGRKTIHEWILIEHHGVGGVPKGSYITTPDHVKKFISIQYSEIAFEQGRKSGGVIIFRDITQILVAQQKAIEERDNMIKMFNELPIGMMIIDKNLKIVNVNHSFTQFIGFSEKQLIGSVLGDAINCIWSMEKGCGHSNQCLFCKLRHQLNAFISIGEPFKDFLTEIKYRNNELERSSWINLCFLPSHYDGDVQYLVTVEDFTERISHERSLREARNMSMTILDSLPMMVFRLNSIMTCDFINETFKSFFQIEKAEQFVDVFSKMPKEEKDVFMQMLHKNFVDKKPFNIEFQITHHTDVKRQMLLLGRPMMDSSGHLLGYLGVLLDVNDERIAEQLYRRSQKKYFSLFQNIESSISYFNMIYDHDGNISDAEIIECNQATYKILSAGDVLLIGQKLSELDFISSHDRKQLLNRFDEVLKTGESYHLNELYFSHMDKWLELSIYSPEKDYVALLITDINEKKLTETALLKEKERSEEANHAKSEFLANMSHEIRTPLNGIVGMIDLTLMEPVNDEQLENLKTAKDCVTSLIDIINDVLDFSKIEAGKMRIEVAPFVLTELIENTIKLHLAHLHEKNLELSIDFTEVVQDQLLGDAKRIKQVLNNLISNAIKFTDRGGVTIKVTQTRQKNNSKVLMTTINVIDTGIGIDTQKQNLLFNSFTQIDGSYTRQYGGTGLGLVISKQLVEMMSGAIRFSSIPGEGSSFEFTLPLEATDDTIGDRNHHEVIFNAQLSKKLLLVEDDKVNQMVMKKMIEREGLSVSIAENGYDALSLCNQFEYDLILMDIQMPVMDGIEATRQIRMTSQYNRLTPIVALTAFALKGDEEIFKASGMDGYVSKPIDRLQLVKILNEILVNSGKTYYNTYGQINDITEIIGRADIGAQSPKVLTKEALFELRVKTRQLRSSFDQENYVMLEVNAHQLKVRFDALRVEELKNLAFKIELELRKERYERVKVLIDQLDNIINGLYESGD